MRDPLDTRPNWDDPRDWDAELKDDENPRPDVQRARRRSMTMRLEMRPQEDRERE